MVGKTLGHYKIIEPLGRGGMGEVYRARDTKLDRDVAIKVLPEDFATDPERLARFEREAKLLASLNHANIAAIYGLEDEGDQRFIAMELVEGETLAQRIACSGRIEVEEALEIARQIAEALEAAHENGVIHRDLKPANVIVTPDGKAKVLDFGLAKAYEADGSASVLSHSPTLTLVAATRTGVILGTAAYMSPEQAKGKVLDKRTDIWSFGALLYEMLTGRRPFARDDVQETLAAVLRDDPDWDGVPEGVPFTVVRLLRRCLQREPRRRLRDIGDARIEIEEARGAERAALTGAPGRASAQSTTSNRLTITLAMVAVVATAIAVWTFVGTETASAPGRDVSFTVTLPPGQTLTINQTGTSKQRSLAMSRDGSHLVYAAVENGVSQLYLRPIGATDATPIEGSEGGYAPFFSPDGRQVGFFTNAGLWHVDREGGLPEQIADVGIWPRGATWADDDTVYFSHWSTLPELVAVSIATKDRQAYSFEADWPAAVPGLDVLLSGPAAVFLDGSSRRRLLPSASNTRYVPTGHLVFADEGTIRAASFDLERLELTSSPGVVHEGVLTEPDLAQFAVSDEGTLAYVPGRSRSIGRLVWVDNDVDRTTVPIDDFPANRYGALDLSPDDRYLAVMVQNVGIDSSRWELHIYDLLTGRGRDNLLVDGGLYPRWSPDGEWLAYSRANGVYRARADGSEPERVSPLDAHLGAHPHTWSPDGRYLIYGVWSTDSGTSNDLFVIDLEGDGEPIPFAFSTSLETQASFAPDGERIAFSSDQTGDSEIFIAPFPDGAPRTRVSPANGQGGFEPLWSADGKELYYRETTSRVMVVPVADDGTPGAARLLVERDFLNSPEFNYDVASDGRVIAILPVDDLSAATRINVVLNWFEKLKRLVPTGGSQ